MEIIATDISGCYEIKPLIYEDNRGNFVKTFHEDVFSKYSLVTQYAEEYYSVSRQGVLRGLHFQIPPKEHTKLVYCVQGEVIDIVVDLRKGSPTQGRFFAISLNDQLRNMLYIPAGLAHGFYVKSEYAIMMYKVTSTYSPEHDTGILWNSIGYDWPDPRPIVSGRDSSFIRLNQFDSPFVYK